MTFPTPSITYPYDAEAGFAERLEDLLELNGLRRHGRKTRLSEISGLTVGGVRLFQEQDRPPKDPAFSKICQFLSEELTKKFRRPIEDGAVRQFLLSGEQDEAIGDLLSKPSEPLDYDPVYAGEVILQIRSIATQMGIDMNSPEWLGKVHIIDQRFIKYCHTNRPDLHSSELAELIVSMIKICSTDHTLLS